MFLKTSILFLIVLLIHQTWCNESFCRSEEECQPDNDEYYNKYNNQNANYYQYNEEYDYEDPNSNSKQIENHNGFDQDYYYYYEDSDSNDNSVNSDTDYADYDDSTDSYQGISQSPNRIIDDTDTNLDSDSDSDIDNNAQCIPDGNCQDTSRSSSDSNSSQNTSEVHIQHLEPESESDIKNHNSAIFSLMTLIFVAVVSGIVCVLMYELIRRILQGTTSFVKFPVPFYYQLFCLFHTNTHTNNKDVRGGHLSEIQSKLHKCKQMKNKSMNMKAYGCVMLEQNNNQKQNSILKANQISFVGDCSGSEFEFELDSDDIQSCPPSTEDRHGLGIEYFPRPLDNKMTEIEVIIK